MLRMIEQEKEYRVNGSEKSALFYSLNREDLSEKVTLKESRMS